MNRPGVEAAIASYSKRIAECERTGKVDLQYPDRLYLRGSGEYEHALRSWRAAKAFYEDILKKENKE